MTRWCYGYGHVTGSFSLHARSGVFCVSHVETLGGGSRIVHVATSIFSSYLKTVVLEVDQIVYLGDCLAQLHLLSSLLVWFFLTNGEVDESFCIQKARTLCTFVAPHIQ